MTRPLPPVAPPASPWTFAHSGSFAAVAESQDGVIIVAASTSGHILISKDSGGTWADAGAGSKEWADIAISSNGSHIIACWSGDGSTPGSAGIAVSANTATSWTTPTLTGADASGLTGAGSVAISGDGTLMFYGDGSFAEIWQSSNSGGSFAKITALSSPVVSMKVSRDGSTLIASSGALAFLYSGGDGMFASADGTNWTAAPNSVAAVGMAWIDNVWVAITMDGHTWRSVDGAIHWVAGPDILNVQQIAAMRPAGVDESGKKHPGVFAAWSYDADLSNQLVSLSHDLGVTWDSPVLTLPTSFGEDGGTESVESLSGAGGVFFLTTQWSSDSLDGSNGKVYICTDGMTFNDGDIILGPASESPATPSTGFSIFGVNYDQSTGVYTLFGSMSSAASGTTATSAIYTTSMTPTFTETATGTTIYTTSWNVSGGHALQNAHSGAVGNGYGAVVVPIENTPETPSSFTFSSLSLTGTKADLFTASDAAPQYVPGPTCFKSNSFTPGEASMAPFPGQTTDTSAMFACVVMASNVTTGAAEGGGVYTALAGQAFTKTHDGTLIQGSNGGLFEPVGAAIATGSIGFALVPPAMV